MKGFSVDTMIAFFALLISSISILISILSIRQQKRMNSQNLQAIYFKELFQDYLINRIPQVALKLGFDNEGRLKHTYREINRTMMEMIKGARYFAFADLDFYNELKMKSQNLEDELANISNQQIKVKEKQDEAIIHINTLISGIVDFINKKYCK